MKVHDYETIVSLTSREEGHFVPFFGHSMHVYVVLFSTFIKLDATHLSENSLGVLMIVIGVDGSNKLYHVAFGIVEIEGRESWEWFPF